MLNGGQIELVDELFADDWRFGNSTGEGVVERFFEWFNANEARIEILEHIADEKWVYIMFRLTYRWPDYAKDSDKKETDTLIRHARMRIENGKIVEFRLIASRLNQLKELSGFEGSFEDMVKVLSSK